MTAKNNDISASVQN